MVPPPTATEERVIRLEERLKSTDEQVRVFAPMVLQVAEITSKLEAAVDDLHDIKKWIGDVERRLQNQIEALAATVGTTQAEWLDREKTRAENRWKALMALIAVAGIVVAILSKGG